VAGPNKNCSSHMAMMPCIQSGPKVYKFILSTKSGFDEVFEVETRLNNI
jgi:hypothetical protein